MIWALADNQNSVRMELDNEGNVVSEIIYDTFGNITAESNPSDAIMNQEQSSKLLKSLLEQNPKQVIIWLNLIFSKQINLPKGFNWLGFSELSASKARQFAKKTQN